ncbi:MULTISPECIES: hypothetical protein [Frankia]|uniref:hypothetical protein n=1 Tax=Frankia TaxID=1854 RepID=UPI00156A8382|nr:MULTISPECIES: hypothetical protein [Frankia]
MTVRLVTAIMIVVVGLSFLFAFGNVWLLALRLGARGRQGGRGWLHVIGQAVELGGWHGSDEGRRWRPHERPRPGPAA